jgi:Ca2+-dependent lipid-binding protein
LEGYGLGNFKFDKVVLGQIPPRITGIKVYDKNTSRKEIIMDLDLIFASDCDIKFSVKGVKAKISDFSLRGLLRVVFKPLVTEIPLIGGVQVYFLSPPEINFDLGGVANCLDVPGLSNIIRNVVIEQISNFVVLPNKITVPLATGVGQEELKCPSPSGVLRVRLLKAEKLVKKDIGVLGMGKSDPYATLTVGSRKHTSERIDNTVNPEWNNFVADFPIEVVRGQELLIELFDHDDNREDEPLGRATVATGLVADKGQISDMWVDLEDVKSGRALLSLSWLQVTSDQEDIDQMKGEGLTKCLLEVFIDSCKGLVEKSKKPCPIVVMDVGGKDKHSTWAQNYTIDPVFEQGFVLLVVNPQCDDLHLKVLDSAISSDPHDRNALLGELNITISDLMRREKMAYSPPQPFNLKSGTGTITLSVKLKGLKKSVPNNTMSTSVKGTKETIGLSQKKESLKKEESMRSTISDVTEPLLDDGSKLESTPSLDEIMSSTIDPMIKITGNDVDLQELMVEEEETCTMRKRSNVLATGPNGKIKLSTSYNMNESQLNVTVHEARGLPGGDLPDPPDPYVKLYLLPERNKKSKRKSDVIKDTVNPTYDETFEVSKT